MTSPTISLSPKLHAFGWLTYRQRGISGAKVAPGWPGFFGLLILWGALFAITLPAWGKDYETVTFRAPHLDGRDVPLNVILPMGYDGSEKRFPVLYLLHGYTVHYSSWVLHSGITQSSLCRRLGMAGMLTTTRIRSSNGRTISSTMLFLTLTGIFAL